MLEREVASLMEDLLQDKEACKELVLARDTLVDERFTMMRRVRAIYCVEQVRIDVWEF